MTCKQCGGERFANVNGKCSDLSFTDIPHLDLEHDGYVPDLGVGSGDYVEVSFCLDCGQIPNWKPVTDEMIFEMEEFARDPEMEAEEEALVASEPDVFDMKAVEKQRIAKIMASSYGPAWIENAEAREILANTLESDAAEKPLRAAIKDLLGIK